MVSDGVSYELAGAPSGVSYLCFWIWSPRPLDNLLLEPNVPGVDLVLPTVDPVELWLNGKCLFGKTEAHTGTVTAVGLPLRQGWNNILLRVGVRKATVRLDGEFSCSQPEFLKELGSALEVP